MKINHRVLFLILLCLGFSISNAQNVKIADSPKGKVISNTGGSDTPASSSILDVRSKSKGILIPRMTGLQRAGIARADTGLLVFQPLSDLGNRSLPGLYVFTADDYWERFATTSDATWTKVGENQYNKLDGNVGIGTSSPNEKLEVKGKFKMSNSTTNSLILNADPLFGNYIEFKDGTTNNAKITESAGTLTFSSLGNVGHLKLYPNGDINTGSGTAFSINGTGNSEPSLEIVDDSPEIRFKVGASQKGGLYVASDHLYVGTSATNTVGSLRFMTKNTMRGVVDADGNFGLGTANPLEKLHVNGHAIMNATDALLRLQTGGVDKAFVQLVGNNLRLGTFATNSSANLIFRVANADRFTINQNGNVNISNELVVNKKLTVNENLEAIKINGDNPAINFFEAGTQRAYVWAVDDNLNIGTSLNTGKIIMTASQFQLGTSVTVPNGYKMGVGGKIICEELKVRLQSAGWPDYVFDQKYKLSPLYDLEKYIKENHHLPNIPDAKEIEKEGIELGEMQRRTMEKVEELTLYIIELKKEIDELKASKK
ncbi:hypothetical protein EGI22_04870 [Lacihabitans sp. LS3-19]|uniref:hypothetical protein n=1 Tax=Lacihabitans sp. LS3-19 TaxID=2487335 RepID=UPI0020CE8D1B|nr:hypothetical protein [Lacihabitans sp. LS3-19]MCP9767232.1 hypothetical protein [Lacihabitans sp. LS3-19]